MNKDAKRGWGVRYAQFETLLIEHGDSDECLEWPHAVGSPGYGTLTYRGRLVTTHRLAFYLAHGRWPVVCRHMCDNKPCFNPKHLLDGTHADNLRDAYERGLIVQSRESRNAGSAHGMAKLNDQAVQCIRWLADHGRRYGDIGAAYGLSRQYVGRIARRQLWHSVPEYSGSEWSRKPAMKGTK